MSTAGRVTAVLLCANLLCAGVLLAVVTSAPSSATTPQVSAIASCARPSSSVLRALPWDRRIDLERAMADCDPRYAPRVEGAVARLESRGVTASIARSAQLTVGERQATLRATSIGRGDARTELREVDAEIVGVEVRAERAPGVVEWWRELASGLEHGLTISARPTGEGELDIELEVRGLETRTAVDAIELVHEGHVIARYAHLTVLDARHARIPARMRATASGIAIEVDDADAEYPLVIDPLVAAEEEPILAAGVAMDSTGDSFGWSIALTSSGDRALVAAHLEGYVLVLRWTGTTWTREATLTAEDDATDDEFGYSIALTANGDRALVGAPYDDNAMGNDAGSAHVFLRTGTRWDRETILIAPDGGAGHYFGGAVALTAGGDRALIGADQDGNGSAQVWVWREGTWVPEQTLRAPDGAANDDFGWSVALNSSGDVALVGAIGDDTADSPGSAHVFARRASWTHEATLRAPDGAASDEFGYSVALSSSGDRALVGARLDDTPRGVDAGSAHVFVRTGSWTHEARLSATDGAANDEFGWSVALNSSGDRALVGAWTDDIAEGSRADGGSARLFVRSVSTWAEDATLLAGDGATGDRLGSSVALTWSGDRALVGASEDDTPSGVNAGSARVFTIVDGGTSTVDHVSGFRCDGRAGAGAGEQALVGLALLIALAVRRRRAGWAALAIVLSLTASPAFAQDDATLAQARVLADRARAEFNDDRFEPAAELFEQSLALFERPSTLYNLGRSYSRLGRDAEALALLERFLEVSDASTARVAADARARIDELRPRMVRLRLTIEPRDASVEVDGSPARVRGRWVGLAPGPHRVRIEAPGRIARTLEIDARGGDVLERDIALESVSSVEAARVEPSPTIVDDPASLAPNAVTDTPRSTRSVDTSQRDVGIALLVGGGLSAVAGAVATGLWAEAVAAINGRIDDGQCTIDPATESVISGDCLSQQTTYRSAGIAAWIGYGVGAAALGTGLALVLTAPSPRESAAHLLCAPFADLGLWCGAVF